MNNSQLSPYLHFNGNCEAAMQFYQSVLGGDLQISRYRDFASPDMPVPETQQDGVMHSTLTNGSMSFMASDGGPGNEIKMGDNVAISIAGSDEAALTAIFNGLADGGSVQLPLAPQVWGDTFGMLADKYGINWMINISKQAD